MDFLTTALINWTELAGIFLVVALVVGYVSRK